MVELSVVLLLVSLLLALAANSLRGPYNQTKESDFREQIVSLDRFARSFASRNHCITTMSFDRQENQLAVFSGAANDERPLSIVRLAPQLKLERILGRDGEPIDEIQFGIIGQSGSYAIELANMADESTWTVVLGASGQRIEVANHYEAQQLLSNTLRPHTN